MPRLKCWAYTAGCIFPWRWHPSAETRRRFNIPYELYVVNILTPAQWTPDTHSYNINTLVYSMSREECAIVLENVPYFKVHQPNPKHLYPKLNCYGDNGGGKCGLLEVPCTVPVARVVTRTLRMSVLQSHSRVKHIPTYQQMLQLQWIVIQYCWIFMYHVKCLKP